MTSLRLHGVGQRLQKGLHHHRLHYQTKKYQQQHNPDHHNHVTKVAILGGGPVGLLLSTLLTSYKVPHTVIERRASPTKHPQAHFMNARTMEILLAHLPATFRHVRQSIPAPHNWRDFCYCYSVLGHEYARVDHFSARETDPGFWRESPTNVVHLPQNKFEHILRGKVMQQQRDDDDCTTQLWWGYEALNVVRLQPNMPLQVHVRPTNSSNSGSHGESAVITCDYVVAADGAHSLTRRLLDIPMRGESSLQTLINVHFTCPGLGKLLQRPRPAMLYFTFNEAVIAVFVAHDPDNDEWVCQIPIFPPFKSLEDFDRETLIKLLRRGLGFQDPHTATQSPQSPPSLPINILTVNTWTMQAQVAERYQSPCGGIFLAGDAAHRFPPAGGFGMNTGLQDVHNLAWKLAWVTSGLAGDGLLSTYEQGARWSGGSGGSGGGGCPCRCLRLCVVCSFSPSSHRPPSIYHP